MMASLTCTFLKKLLKTTNIYHAKCLISLFEIYLDHQGIDSALRSAIQEKKQMFHLINQLYEEGFYILSS